MKASTLFTLALALFVGLGLVIAVKYSGLLNPPEKKVEAPPPPPPPPPLVLVAAHNMYPGDAISPGAVRLRPVSAEESVTYQKDLAKYLPAVVEAAFYRVALKNIEANQPITKDMLEPMGKPEPLHARLAPLTRAIDVQITAENSAAGLIQVDDWVDVYLTTVVGRTDAGEGAARTALLARNVQVVAKRGTLYHTYAPLPPGPIQFMLAPNLYRAALIDYARNKGVLSLQPVSASEKDKLDALKKGTETDPDTIVCLSLTPDSEESKEELRRVHAHDRSEAVAGDEDLIRIFDLRPLVAPSAPLTVEYITGTKPTGGAAFMRVDGVLQAYTAPEKPSVYTFTPPKAPETNAGGPRGLERR